MKYFLIIATCVLVAFGGIVAKEAYDRGHAAPVADGKKAETSSTAFDFWTTKRPLYDVNGNVMKPINN